MSCLRSTSILLLLLSLLLCDNITTHAISTLNDGDGDTTSSRLSRSTSRDSISSGTSGSNADADTTSDDDSGDRFSRRATGFDTSVVQLSSAAKCPKDDTLLLSKCYNLLNQIRLQKKRVAKLKCNNSPRNVKKEDCETILPYLRDEAAVIDDALDHERHPLFICHAHLNRADSSYSSSPNCIRYIEGKRICLFIHGVGKKVVDAWRFPEGTAQRYAPYLSSMKSYWGDVQNEVSSSCSPVFFMIDTIQGNALGLKGWNYPELQQDVCGAIAFMRPAVIITHSMGGLIVAAGKARNAFGCDLIGTNNNKVRWIGVQNPWHGSGGLNWLSRTVCPISVGAKFSDLAKVGTKVFKNYCDGSRLKQVYKTLVPEYVNEERLNFLQQKSPQLDCATAARRFGASFTTSGRCVELRAIARDNLFAAVCGTSADGVAGRPSSFSNLKAWVVGRSLKLATVSQDEFLQSYDPEKDNITAPPTPRAHDGLVETVSCAVSGRNYTTNYNDRWYYLRGNHAEGRCTFGDGRADDQKPCAFIRVNVEKAVEQVMSYLDLTLPLPPISAAANL